MRTFYLFFIVLLLCNSGIYSQSTVYNNRQSSLEQEEKDSLKTKWKGSYLSVSGSIGSSSADYKLNSLGEKGSRSGKMGYGFEVKYSYFFNPHWGLTTGLGVSNYSSVGKLKGSMAEDTYYSIGHLTDDDWQNAPKDYELRGRVTNLDEKQTIWLLDIPVMLSYQTYFGDSARWGIYGGAGVKIQIPFSSQFKIQNGGESLFNVSGKYEGIPTDMGSPINPPVPQHGYGTITDPNSSLSWNDKSKLKMGIAATAELGFMFDIGKGMDLMVGGYVDYGLSDIKKNKKGLFTAPAVYHPGADGIIGNAIKYNGMLDSDVTGKIKLVSFGGKVTLRFQMGGNK